MRRRAARPSNEEALETALVAVLANTGSSEGARVVNRNLDLVALADHLQLVVSAMGGVSAASQRLDLSPQQIRDFLSVRRLVPAAKRYIRSRQINSVDAAARLARLPGADQATVAAAMAARKIDSRDDIRAILALRRSAPEMPVEEVIRKVTDTRDIKEHLVEFLAPEGKEAAQAVRRRFARLLGDESIRWLQLGPRFGVLAMTTEGLRRLQSEARRRRVTKRELVDALVKRGRR